MFGKKDDKKPALPNIKIEKIPDDFYAGTNPVVKFKAVEKQVDTTPKPAVVLSSVEKKIFDKQTAVGAGSRLHPINLLANGKFLILLVVIFLFLGGAIMGGYYYWQYRKTVQLAEAPVAPPIVSVPVVVPTPEPSTPAEVTPPAPEAPPINTESKLDFPSTLLAQSADSDKDQISDVAEELFKTDPSVADTDGDKYPDGHEVFYLYNPAGIEPMKLIDSNLVKVYNSPTFFYELFYPTDWAVGNVDAESKDVLFSTLSGENIEVRVMDKDLNQSFEDWFATNVPNEKFADYAPFESVFKENGWARQDGLVYFFPKDDKVFAIVYHTTDSNTVNYKIVAVMMARSFQFGQATALPERTVEDNVSNPSPSSSPILVTSTAPTL